jgi:HSP20 family protein
MQQAWPPTQQLGSTPQGLGQQLPQIQQPTPAQQFGQLQPQGSLEQPRPQGQLGQLQPQQVGQFGTPPVVSSQSVPQGQTAQVPHVMGQQIPQQLGQQIPQQAQWGAQASGQPTGQSAPSMGPSSIERSVQSTAQSLPPQMQEFGTGSAQQVSEQAQQRLTGTPSIDIVDTPDELVLFVDLPGYEEENIKIQADGQNLTVSAERRDEEQEEGQKYAHERPQKLQRTVPLPTRANVNEADASYENGVCKITLPKMEEDIQHEIAFQ